MRLLAISLLGLTLLTARAYAQDAHYWTDQYGSRSRLLGGAVIGSVDDLAAVYYNPARLALIPDPGLLLSTMACVYHQDRALPLEPSGTRSGSDLSIDCRYGATAKRSPQAEACRI